MFTLAIPITDATVGPDTMHQDCTCKAVVLTVPDGSLSLFGETLEAIETLGWRVIEEVERQRAASAAAAAPASPNGTTVGLAHG